MTPDEASVPNELVKTPFYKALRSRVCGPEEALGIAATNRRHAAEARNAKPASIDDYRDHCHALRMEQRARRHDEIVTVCEQHAASLRARG